MNEACTRQPAGPYLIESAPQYARRKACLRLQRFALLPVRIVCAAIEGYRSELRHMLDAGAIYPCPGS